jgi:hypothetical protein
MSIFSSIMNRIFHHGSSGSAQAAGGTTTSQSTAAQGAPGQQAQTGAASAQTGGARTTPPPMQPVDVEAVLGEMARKKGGGGNYRTSIVDLLKLLDLDSSLNARKELAKELNVHAGADGSAEQNIALQKAVMQKLAENGGKVPDSLRN